MSKAQPDKSETLVSNDPATLATGELKDAELDGVAGGKAPPKPVMYPSGSSGGGGGGSSIPMSNGDNAGTTGGVASGKVMK